MARAITSSTDEKRSSGSTGPKASSVTTRVWSGGLSIHQRERHEVAATGRRGGAAQQREALRAGFFDQPQQPTVQRRVLHRAHVHAGLQAVAHHGLLHHRQQPVAHGVVDAVVDASLRTLI